MDGSTIVNKALVDENADLQFTIKDKIIIGEPLQDDFETESISSLLLKNLSNVPDFVGQINVQIGEKMTFAQFKDRSIRCALTLKKLGISEGDVVCTSYPLHNDDYAPILASIFIGAIINPWPHTSIFKFAAAAEYLFQLTQPKILFAWYDVIDMLVSAAKKTKVDCKFVVLGKHPDYPSLSDLMAEQLQTEIDDFRHVEPEDPKKQVGALLFTSGTTNDPKAIMLSYETLVRNRFHYMIARTHCNLLIYSSYAWNTAVFFFTMCIRKFLTRILHTKFSAEGTAAVIEKFKVNLTFLNTTQLTILCKSDVFKKYDFSKLEVILVGANKPRSSILEATRKALPHAQISNTLGMTDTGGRLTVQTKKCQTKNSIGRVVGSVQLKIVDPKSGLLLGANQEGEMCFKLDNMMIGYLNNPEETKKTIDDEGWLHSGDIGYYDENEEVWHTDRLKQIIIRQSIHIPPSKIEEMLLEHPDVDDAAVVGVPHEIEDERPFAFIVKKPGAKVTSEELKELPARYDEMYHLTAGVAFINEIPHNSNGKKSIKDLKEMALSYAEK